MFCVPKSEARNSKFETNSKFKIRMTKTDGRAPVPVGHVPNVRCEKLEVAW